MIVNGPAHFSLNLLGIYLFTNLKFLVDKSTYSPTLNDLYYLYLLAYFAYSYYALLILVCAIFQHSSNSNK